MNQANNPNQGGQQGGGKPGQPIVSIDPERAVVPAPPAGRTVPAGQRAVDPYTAQASGTGTLAPFVVSGRRPERQGA